jgi:hypothetical protein
MGNPSSIWAYENTNNFSDSDNVLYMHGSLLRRSNNKGKDGSNTEDNDGSSYD